MNTLNRPPSAAGTAPGEAGSGHWARALGVGLLAGLVAAFVMTVVMTLLRVLAGVPLPVELGADQFLPHINVFTFIRLLGRFGGSTRAKEISYFSGFAGQIALGAVLGLVYGTITERERGRDPGHAWRFGVTSRGAIFAAAVVALLWIVTVALFWQVLASNYRGLPPTGAVLATMVGLLVSYGSYGLALPLTYRAITSRAPLRRPAPLGAPVGRRAFVAGGVGVVAALASGGLIRLIFQRSTFGYDGTQYLGADVQPVTPNDRFYLVTKNLVDPYPRKEAWRLDVDGMVDHPRTYGFTDIAALPSVTQATTLECISNGVGGGLISNAVWTGVPLHALIEAAGPQAGVTEVLFHGTDGYLFNAAFDRAMARATLVAYEMNGVPLPQRHGYPARLIIPGYYGEGNVKWVTRIELVGHGPEGYYATQGWKAEFVHTMSRIDGPRDGQAIKLSGAATVPLHGVAFAGDRSVSKVEVSVDGGRTWREATIAYRPSRLTWAFWRYDWRPTGSGAHHLLVRATDGTGKLQPDEKIGSAPAGSSGRHKITVHVVAA